MNTGSSPIVLKIPSIAVDTNVTINPAKSEFENKDSLRWILEWKVSDGKSTASYNFFGTVNRKEAWQPPGAIGRNFSTSFETSSNKLIESYINTDENGGIWSVEVSAFSGDNSYTATIAGIEKLPKSIKVVLIDRKRRLKMKMNEESEFKFAFDNKETNRKLQIVAGDSTFVAKATAGIMELPVSYALYGNIPNPFNPSTTIKYTVAEKGKGRELVSLKVFDARGRFVKALVNGKQESGYYKVNWDGRNERGVSVGSGVYFYRISIGREFIKSRKMIVLK
jgi:hypothetical protein